MDKLHLVFHSLRSSVAALIATVVIAVGLGFSWTLTTSDLIRKDKLFREGKVEVLVEGISEKSLRDAEDDAKKKALEKANGLFINYQRKNSEENVTTLDADGSDFRNRQEDSLGLSMTGDADFFSINYLERKKHEDELYHVKIQAVVRLKNEK